MSMASSFNPISLNFDGNPAPKIRKYNTWQAEFTWTDSAGVAVDLSYYSANMQIRKNTQAVDILSISTSNSRIVLNNLGKIKLKIPAADTTTLIPGTYLYSLVLSDTNSLDTNGEGMNTFTLLLGEITVEDSVTRES